MRGRRSKTLGHAGLPVSLLVMVLAGAYCHAGQRGTPGARPPAPYLELHWSPGKGVGEVRCLGFDRTSNVFFAGSLNSWVYFWTTRNWKKVLVLPPAPPARGRSGHQFTYRELDACAISPNGRFFALSSGGTTSVFSVPEGNMLKEINLWGDALAFSPDGKLLAVSAHGTARLLDTTTWTVASTLRLPSSAVSGSLPPHIITTLAFSPDGTRLAGATDDGATVLWSLVRQGRARVLAPRGGGAASVGFSPDGRLLASASDEKNGIGVYVWRAGSGKLLAQLPGADVLGSAVFSPGGRVLASSYGDEAVRVWRVNTWAEVCSLRTGGNSNITFSQDGKWLATGGGGLSVSIWHAPPCR